MAQWFGVIAAALTLLLATGCSSTIAKPNILHPGSLAYQRWRAEVFDPYPVPYLGTPVEGGRPMQYRTPVPEPQDFLLERDHQPGPLFQRFNGEPNRYDLQPIF
jgi:hypothetical protein